MKRVDNVTIGCDIEVFLMHKDTRKLISAEGYVDGTKHEPFNFDPADKYFATSLDNVAAEFCIPPVTDKEKFFEYITKSLNYINSKIPEYMVTAATPAGIFDDDQLQTENAKLFGCEPDYCVWDRTVNEKPKAENANLRSCGGHIHIGYANPDMETSEYLVKLMDLCVGVPSVLQEPDNQRKTLYGKSGCFRPKDYGLEYRTVSNYYAGDKRLSDWVFDATQNAIRLANEGFDVDQYKDRIRQAIDGNDKVTAQNLINELDLQLA